MHTKRGARRLRIAYGADGSSVDPRSINAIVRTFRLRRGQTIRAHVSAIVPNVLYRVIEVENEGPTVLKRGGYLKVYVVHNPSWAVHQEDPTTWIFDYSEDAYRVERSVAYQTAWCGEVELPLLQGQSLELGDLYAMAVRLRKANVRSRTQFEKGVRGVLDSLMTSTMQHDRLFGAIQKLETITEVNPDRLPQIYPVVWCAQDRVDDAVAALEGGRHTYGRLGDAMRVHNRIAVSLVHGLHDDLDQMAQSTGEFATLHRAERLREYVEAAKEVKARPWTRVMAHVAKECGQAAVLVEERRGEEARALIGRSVRSLKTYLLRDEGEQIHARLGIVDKLGVPVTNVELMNLGEELGRIRTGFQGNRDDDFELPVIRLIVPAIEGARLQVLNDRQSAKRRVNLAIANLRPAFKAA